MEAALASCLLVAAAEMGDKTQLLAFVLAARLKRPWPILAGILVATVVNHTLAAGVGSVAGNLIPPAALAWIVGVLFVAFGFWSLRPDALDDAPLTLPRHGAFIAALTAFFLAEMGDKTRFATMALAARYQDFVAVVCGTTAGMMIADAPAVWIGDRLSKVIPVRLMRRLSAVLFFIVGAMSLWKATHTGPTIPG